METSKVVTIGNHWTSPKYSFGQRTAVYTRMGWITRIAQIIIHEIAPDLGLR